MKFLPLVFLVVLTVLAYVHGRAIHRLRRSSSYYANESACIVDDVAYYNGDPVPSSDPCEECKCRTPGFVCTITECEEKEGCQRIKVPGECCSYQCDKSSSEEVTQGDVKDVPVSTTLVPTSTSSDVGEKVQEHVHQDKEEHVQHDKEEKHIHAKEGLVHHTKEESKDESDVTKTGEPTSEIITTARPPIELHAEKQQERPEGQPQSDEEEQKPSKRSEPTTSAASVDLSSQETSSVESSSKATEEPESSTGQESGGIDKKIEAVTEPKKEGRSGSDEPKIEVTSSAPAEHSSVSPQEPEKASKDQIEESIQKDDPASSPTGTYSGQPSASIEKRHFPGEQKEPTSESPKVEKDSVTEIVSEAITSSKDEEYEIKGTSASGVSSEEHKSGQVEVIVVSTTPQVDSPEAREISDEQGDETKEADSEQQDPTSPKQDQEIQTTAAPSSSSTEETKESEEGISPTAKSGPSKRFADWVDYVPRDFQA